MSIQDLKARLSGAVAAAESGATILITRHSEPVARLGPAQPPGVHRGGRVGTGRLIRRWPGERADARWRCCSRIGAAGEPAAEPRLRRRLYLDTSAYLCILLGEEGSSRLAKETAGAELLSSVLLVLEARRNLIRLAREGTLAAAQYKACLIGWSGTWSCSSSAISLWICVRRISSPRGNAPFARPRTPAHRTLVPRAERLDRFVTLDGSQAQAARELGLPV